MFYQKHCDVFLKTLRCFFKSDIFAFVVFQLPALRWAAFTPKPFSIMAIEYKAIPRKMLSGPDQGKDKFYAIAKLTGNADLDDLTTDIEQASTVNGADIRAVLYGLFEAIPTHLKAGNSVDLGDIGRLRISISSQGEDTADAVSSKSVTKARIIFKPSKKFGQLPPRTHLQKDRLTARQSQQRQTGYAHCPARAYAPFALSASPFF